jgi:glycosyltransferase involved in cell wall biosynthesis
MTRVVVLGTRGYPSYYGGFETAVRRLAPYLVDKGMQVTVYGRKDQTLDDHRADARVKTVSTVGLATKSLSTLTYGFTSTLHAAVMRPDVALVMNVANGFWLPLLRWRGIPIVVNVDGMEWEREKWGRLAKWVFKTGARLTARWADEIVVDARAIGERWRHEFGRVGIFIPYGGDAPAPLPLKDDLEPGSYVLIVARFVPENTIGEFFDAVPSLAETHDVVIVGSSSFGGELDARAEALARTHPRVRWLGHVSDDERLFALWQNAGAYFHGHSVGGTNPALVQAMACGTPTVARDTIYNREVLDTAAVYVQPNARDITRGLIDLLNDDARRKTLGERAQKRAASSYSWAGVCLAYEQALRSARHTRSPASRVRNSNP